MTSTYGRNQLLVDKLDDLRARLERVRDGEGNIDYNVLEIGRILYHVLCSDLLDDVMEEVRSPEVLFRVMPKDALLSKGTLLAVGPSPLVAPSPGFQGYEWVSLGRFRNRAIATYMMQQFTVQDVLNLLSNVLGGKHHRPTDKERLNRLHELSDFEWKLEGPFGEFTSMPGLMREWVAQIGDATVTATYPLVEVLRMRS